MADSNQAPGDLSLTFVDALYADYLRDPQSVSADWRRYFEKVAAVEKASRPAPAARPTPVPLTTGPNGRLRRGDTGNCQQCEMALLQERVDQLVRAYRERGHMVAQIDPLGRTQPTPPELEPRFYGFTEEDMELRFAVGSLHEAARPTLRQIIAHLRNTYCRSIGVEYMHIDDPALRLWLQERMEPRENRVELTPEEQARILTRLSDAVIFEEFIQRKYLGAKTFSLEGAESLIPLLDLAIEKAGEMRFDEIVIGMAHRGRLNVLSNIMGKSAREIFSEFEDAHPEAHLGGGDVKYHLGYSTDWQTTAGQKVHLSLCFNPSHLEFVDPVAEGRMRAKQDREQDPEHDRGMVLLIHGDAAFAGEGVVQETLNLSRLEGYTTGGTLHIIVNNQIGFITPPSQGRSTPYASDVAKMLQVPIFHVNGEDPEAVAQVVRLAMDFRQAFKRDVVIDMYCYRRRGHNEGDEPTFTQPLLYKAIQQRKSVREGYLEHLLQLGGMTREQADEISSRRRELLDRDLAVARRENGFKPPRTLTGVWRGYEGGPEDRATEAVTAVSRDRLVALLRRLAEVPQGFHPHPTIARALAARKEMAEGKRPLDWSAAEALALATLSTDGVRIRMSGQDSERGTFSQRHAMLHDVEQGQAYMPLQHLDPDQAPVEIYNSPLSEAAVLGFEYGYSLDCPEGLVLWEAQFGDFSNAAQVIIDQFIASAEDKWQRLSGVVLLLPHGFEGMGPEHSSARMERFLALAAEDNIQVVDPSTPAQYFHCLRRQASRRWRKPLVLFTPKSLLRHPRVISSLEDLAEGGFQRVIPDTGKRERPVSRVLICTGKIYYDLEKEREERKRDDVAILRLEQLYPLPERELAASLAGCADGTPVYWVQEEPENMGAWRYLRVRLGNRLAGRFPFSGICRAESASPATGSASAHKMEQGEILEQAFGEEAPAMLREEPALTAALS